MKYSRLLRGTPTVLGLLFIVGTSLHAQLFQNLQALSNRIPVGSGHLTNPGTYRPDGPKWLSAGDFDADGHADIATTHVNGEVSVVWGNGQRQFSAPQVLPSGLTTLRGLVCQDVNSDGKPDLLAAGPTEGKVALWENLGGRTFRAARLISTYAGARNLALGDFNGDSLPDLAVAGPDSPPLPVGGALHGLIQLRGDATGNFTSVGTVPSIGVRPSNPTGFPLRPLYSVTPFRPAGATVDWLAVTHAESRVLWWLKADALGVLMVEGSVELQPLTMEYPGGVRAIVVGSVFQQSGRGDLLTANSQYGSIEVRAEKPAGQPFGWETSPAQTLHVPGGPRSMQLSDLNGDGWLDLVVAVRNADRILVYRNNAGVFELSSESPAGRSPREMAVADFDEDGAMDFAVVNRDSFDISILPGRPPTPDPIVSFGALDQVYPVDGELAALVVKRLNADNKDDVVQLHRASGEVSVRLAGALGQLDPPVIYPMGTMPNGLAVVDYDRDGKLDLVTANLGAGNTTGAACYRRGLGDGTFGALSEIRISTELAALGISATEAGSLYGIEYGDLDGDGIQDAIAGFIDCRILFYKGNANGSFTLVTSPRGLDHIFINFIFEARGFAIADFDQDGDNDIAAIGAYGDLGTIENRGDLLNPNRSGSLVIRKVGMAQASSDVGWGGSSRTLIVRDLNGDGDPDLLAGMARGTVAFLGQAGMLFEVGQLWDATVPPPREFSIPVVNMAVSSMAQADFDNNGSVDLAVACDVARCMEIQVTNGYGGWSRAVRVAVPSAAFLATGDLDGDGKADLVGTGDVLWVALSGRPAQAGPALVRNFVRTPIPHLVINEIMAENLSVPVTGPNIIVDAGDNPDYVEIFNGGPEVALDGCTLSLVGKSKSRSFTFPAGQTLANNGRLVIRCSPLSVVAANNTWRTGWALPETGGTLCLCANGQEIDRVTYGKQLKDVSYGRYLDGVASFVYNGLPDPGRSNVDNGPLAPRIDFDGFRANTYGPGQSTLFLCECRDDTAPISCTIVYWRTDVTNAPKRRLLLYDDGMHEDGGMLDGQWAGRISPALPTGATIAFYVEAQDLSDQVAYAPSDPNGAGEDDAASVSFYQLAITDAEPTLEISEVVAKNSSFPIAGSGKPDYFEIRNTGAAAVNLAGVGISGKLFTEAPLFTFPNVSLPAHASIIVVCDEGIAPYHAPFKLDADEGGSYYLVRATATGAAGNTAPKGFLDKVTLPVTTADQAYFRIGERGPWTLGRATPNAANLKPGTCLIVQCTSDDGHTCYYIGHSTKASTLWTLEESADLKTWVPSQMAIGDGLERAVPLENMFGNRYYRTRGN